MDVAAQENGFDPGEIKIDIDEIIHQGELSIGDTWYSRVVYLGKYCGQPLLTFTSPTPGPDAARRTVFVSDPKRICGSFSHPKRGPH